MNANALIESPSLRNSVIARTDVLDRVKKLSVLPDDMHVTVEMAASYYEVDGSTIRQTLSRHEDEFKSDGVRTITSKDEAFYTLSQALNPNQHIVKLIPRRALLRMGMLLRDSQVARSVREYLLNSEAAPKVPLANATTNDYDKVTKLIQMLRLNDREQLFTEETERTMRKQIAEMVMGTQLMLTAPVEAPKRKDDRPQWVKEGFGAKRIGELLGLSATKVGIAARKLGLQSEAYGDWYEYMRGDKECRVFIYNEAGRDALIEALGKRTGAK